MRFKIWFNINVQLSFFFFTSDLLPTLFTCNQTPLLCLCHFFFSFLPSTSSNSPCVLCFFPARLPVIPTSVSQDSLINATVAALNKLSSAAWGPSLLVFYACSFLILLPFSPLYCFAVLCLFCKPSFRKWPTLWMLRLAEHSGGGCQDLWRASERRLCALPWERWGRAIAFFALDELIRWEQPSEI